MDEAALEKQRKAGRIGREALDRGIGLIKEGARLLDVANRVEEFIVSKGAFPAFPTNISINAQAAHFTPRHNDGDLLFQRGDLVKLDVGVHVDGYIADTARTTEVSTRNWTEMIRAAEDAVATAIELMRPGVSTRTVGAAIERAILSHGYKPVMNLTGHLLQRYLLHGPKAVPNVGDARHHEESIVEAGDSFAIEPFATNGAGMVEGRKSGNIYRIVELRKTGDKGPDGLAEAIHRDLKTLPFSERWAHKIDPKAPIYLQRLMRASVVMTYPVLVEVRSGMVAQAEHSVVVTEGGCEPTTR